MSAKRFGRLHKATALVPLALLSAAWTASLAGVSAPTAAAGERPDPTLPDGTSVPAAGHRGAGQRLRRQPGRLSASATPTPQQIVSTASTSGIPSAALAAYQRAETVINAADKSCHLTWQLIAAIGRVESNHGRANGNVLDDNGLATPGIYGVALNGANRHHRDRRHRRRPVRQRHRLRPRGRPDAVHPLDLVGRGRGRRRRRRPQPPGHRRRGARHRRLPLLRRRRPRHRRRPARPRSTATTTASPTSTSCSTIMDAYLAGRLHLRSPTAP